MAKFTDDELDQIGDEMNDLLEAEADDEEELPAAPQKIKGRDRIPAWVKEEFDAFLQVMSSMGAEGLTSKFCVIAMEPQFEQGFDEVVYAFAAKMDNNVFIPIFLFEQDLKKWLPVLDENQAVVSYQMRHAPSAEEILARIPGDALTSFEDPDFLVTAEDVDEDEFE